MYRISAIRCLVHLEKCLLDDYYRGFSFVDIYIIVQLCWKIEVIDYRSSSFGILTHTMVKKSNEAGLSILSHNNHTLLMHTYQYVFFRIV